VFDPSLIWPWGFFDAMCTVQVETGPGPTQFVAEGTLSVHMVLCGVLPSVFLPSL